MVKFSNPRLQATFTDWPLGGNRRGQCVFVVETHPKRGFRFTRTTTGKPKTATYGGKAAIVDGDDGRTYLIQHAGQFDFIKIWGSDFMCVDEQKVGKSSVWPQDEQYAELQALIDQANA